MSQENVEIVRRWVQGRGKGGGTPVEVPLALVYVIENDKIARVEEYLDHQEALEAAGLSE